MNPGKGNAIFFVAFLICGLVDHFVICDFTNYENYPLSVNDVSFLMKIYNVFDNMFKECVNDEDLVLEHAGDNWQKLFKDNVLNEVHFLQDMSMELLCVNKKVNSESITAKELMTIFWTWFQTAKYSVLFFQGYMQFIEELDEDTYNNNRFAYNYYETVAKKCAYLATFLGSYAVFYQNIGLIISKVYNRYYEKQSLFDEFGEMSSLLDKFKLNILNSEFVYMRTYRPAEEKFHIDSAFENYEINIPIELYQAFLSIIFYGRKITTNSNSGEENHVGDKEICESAASLWIQWRDEASPIRLKLKNILKGLGSSFRQEEEKDLEIRSPLIELLRKIELLKIESDVAYDDIKYGLDDGYDVDLVHVEHKEDLYVEVFVNKKDGAASLAIGAELREVPDKEPSGCYYKRIPQD